MLAGVQVTAVSSKTNTTAVARLGAFTEGAAQVALYDTPGVVSTRCAHAPIMILIYTLRYAQTQAPHKEADEMMVQVYTGGPACAAGSFRVGHGHRLRCAALHRRRAPSGVHPARFICCGLA